MNKVKLRSCVRRCCVCYHHPYPSSFLIHLLHLLFFVFCASTSSLSFFLHLFHIFSGNKTALFRHHFFCLTKLFIVICKWQNLIQDKNIDTSLLLFEGLPGHKNFRTMCSMMLLLLPPQKFTYLSCCILVLDNQVWRWGRFQNRKSGTGTCLILSQPSGHYMYRTVVTICTTSLTFNNSMFCPHSVFRCFVWIW